ncbi:MAG: cell division ATP-binding protein FtsE [Ruminococcus sp.]|nr:cell division ATP-binding protein FtsE [Ruminococcus sp.]
MVELKNVSVTYSSGVDALNNVSLRINDGDFAFVVGSSGAGKSTMIKLLLKEIDATSGSVVVNGYNLNKLRKKRIPEFRRTLGFVFQDFRLIPSMTVYDNIAFVLRVIDAPTKHIKKRVSYVIDLVGLHDKMNSYPDELSGGEKQRVAIARALVNDPQLIIADEPTGNIDPELSYEIVELLKGINDQGTTILMVTHEHDLVRHFGGRIINISDGEIAYDNVITGLSELPEEIKETDEIGSEFPAETMVGSFIDEEDLKEIDNAANVSEISDEGYAVANTEEDIPISLDDMTPDDIISVITEDIPEETDEYYAAETYEDKPEETAEEIHEQAQAIIAEAEKKLAEVTAQQEAEAAQISEILSENGNAETAAEIAGIANDAVSAETAAEIIPEQPKAAGKKHKKKKHRKSAGASDNSKGGAAK